jgi:hypothetical protein
MYITLEHPHPIKKEPLTSRAWNRGWIKEYLNVVLDGKAPALGLNLMQTTRRFVCGRCMAGEGGGAGFSRSKDVL